jgi:quercetin dioxygenase-like cupin family protein
MRHRICIAMMLGAALTLAGRTSAEETTVVSTPLLSTGTTVVGEPLRYPTNGPAHVTAAIVTLPPGTKTVLHRHGVPLFGYILEGEITVDYGDRGKRTYRAGQAIMEAMDVPHFGADVGSAPVRILTVYMGAEGAPADVIPVNP